MRPGTLKNCEFLNILFFWLDISSTTRVDLRKPSRVPKGKLVKFFKFFHKKYLTYVPFSNEKKTFSSRCFYGI